MTFDRMWGSIWKLVCMVYYSYILKILRKKYIYIKNNYNIEIYNLTYDMKHMIWYGMICNNYWMIVGRPTFFKELRWAGYVSDGKQPACL